MTIRLLATYKQFKPNTIATLASGTETALVAGGNATTDLSGGVPYEYKLPTNQLTSPRLAIGIDGVPIGLVDGNGAIISTFTGITVPGAPTGLTLTAIAGGVLAVMTAPASTGGTGLIGYEVTLSTGQVQLGETTTIAVNAPAGTAVTATAKAINGCGKSVASSVSNSVTPTGVVVPAAPGAPTIGTLVAGNGKVTANWTAAAANGSAITGYTVTLSNGNTATAGGSATSVDVTTPNGTAVTATVRATNGIGTGAASAASNSVTPSTVTLLPLNTRAAADGDSMMLSSTAPSPVFGLIGATKGKLYFNSILAIAGNKWPDVIGRGATIDAKNPGIIFINIGTNQLPDTDTAVAMVAQATGYVTSRRATNPNVLVFIAQIPPRNDSVWNALPNKAAREQVRLDYNSGLAAAAATTPGLVVVTYTGFSTAETVDGLHQNWRTALLMGAAFGAAVDPYLVTTSINTTKVNLLTNPAMTGSVAASGTGVTGFVPTGWGASTSGTGWAAVYSVISKTDIDGNTVSGVQIDITGTADAVSRTIVISQIVNTAAVAGIGVGVEGWADVSLAAGSANIDAIYMSLDNVGTTPSSLNTQIMSTDAVTQRIRTFAYIMGTVDTSVGVNIGVRVNTGPIACSIQIYSPNFQVVQQANP